MGQLTRALIVQHGLALAGRTDLTALANVWLNNWLRSTYRSWTWPFLHAHAKDVPLPNGAASIDFGAGAEITVEASHIYDPIRIYNTDKSIRDNLRVRYLLSGDPYDDEDLAVTGQFGKPELVRIRPDNSLWGKYQLFPYPLPDRDYLLKIEYIRQPADIDTTSGGDDTVPIYPNDETMIAAVVAAAMRYMHKYEEAQGEQARVDDLKAGDKLRYGMSNGINDRIELDTRTFRRGDGGWNARWNGGGWR